MAKINNSVLVALFSGLSESLSREDSGLSFSGHGEVIDHVKGLLVSHDVPQGQKGIDSGLSPESLSAMDIGRPYSLAELAGAWKVSEGTARNFMVETFDIPNQKGGTRTLPVQEMANDKPTGRAVSKHGSKVIAYLRVTDGDRVKLTFVRMA